MAFEHRVTARFYEIDRAGVVFFGRFYEYCHTAFEELLRAIYSSLEECLAHADWIMPLVHSEADYLRPTRLGDRLLVELSVERLGQTSVTFTYRILGDDGALRVQAKLVHAFVDKQTLRSRPVPEDFRAGLTHLGLLGPPTLTA